VSKVLRLLIRIEPDELDGGFVGECVSLPGCMSQGATRGECLANLADAIEAVLTVAEHHSDAPSASRPSGAVLPPPGQQPPEQSEKSS
jgi:antitoxin HicB